MPNKSTVSTRLQPLFDAHVAHELSQFRGTDASLAIQNEVGAMLTWLDATTLHQFYPQQAFHDWYTRNVIERPLDSAATTLLTMLAVESRQAISDHDTQFDALIPRQLFDRIVEQIVIMDDARDDLMRQLVKSPIYSMLLADVLYHSTKKFLLEENPFARRIPGAARFMKLGQDMVNSAMPSLEANVDRNLIAFIKANIDFSVRQSEAFLVKTVDERLVRQAADAFWADTAQKQLSALSEGISAENMTDAMPIVSDLWNHIRQTPFYSNVSRQLIDYVYTTFGDQPIGLMLAGAGLAADAISAEIEATVMPLLGQPAVQTFIEARVRARLTAFYASESAETAFGR